MQYFKKLIFVSTANTCRSQWAAEIMKKEWPDSGMEVISRGIIVLFKEPVNQKAVAIAKCKGIDMEHLVSNQITPEDFGEDVLVLVMTESEKKKLYEEYMQAVNVHSIREFVGEAGDLEVPLGKELVHYGEAFENMERLVKLVIQKFQEGQSGGRE